MSYQLYPITLEYFFEISSQMVLFCSNGSVLSHECCLWQMPDCFQDEFDPVKPIRNFSEVFFAFLLEWTHIIAAFDLARVLLPFPTCVCLCDSRLHTPSDTKYATRRTRETH